MSKTFVIGDIHGCHSALVELLARLQPDPQKDTLIFLGDYIDRGPDSSKVISEVLELRKRFQRLITLKGNHEDALLDYLAGSGQDFYLGIGGRQTLASYGMTGTGTGPLHEGIPAAHLFFLRDLLSYWEDDNHIFVHAALRPGLHLSQQPAEWLFWGGNGRFANQDYDFGKRVVFGHTAMRGPVITRHKIGIDCGAVYGGHLGCLVLPDMNFIKVKSKRYWPIRG